MGNSRRRCAQTRFIEMQVRPHPPTNPVGAGLKAGINDPDNGEYGPEDATDRKQRTCGSRQPVPRGVGAPRTRRPEEGGGRRIGYRRYATRTAPRADTGRTLRAPCDAIASTARQQTQLRERYPKFRVAAAPCARRSSYRQRQLMTLLSRVAASGGDSEWGPASAAPSSQITKYDAIRGPTKNEQRGQHS